MSALIDVMKEELRINNLKKSMPKAEKVVGGNDITKKTVETQKAKHMSFYVAKGGQWMVDNVKCHHCSKCFGTKTKRDEHHHKKHNGETAKTKWTTAGDENWVKSFTRS